MTQPHGAVIEQPRATQPAAALEELRALAAAAGRAPSGDNVQPWHLEVHEADASIAVYVDRARDMSPMNSGQRMSLLTCGAAIENALLLAAERGWKTDLELCEAPDLSQPRPLVARIRLISRTAPRNSEHAEYLIASRVTNRRNYDRRALSSHILIALQDATPDLAGVNTHWICERESIDRLAGIIARADALMFGEPSIRRAILANIRFDLPAKAEASEGLPLAALEASAPERVALRLLRRVPPTLFKLAGSSALFSVHARGLVRSASGLCVISLPNVVPHAEVRIGQALQRAWLAITELGLAAQPMMSLLVLDNALRHGTPELAAELMRRGAPALVDDFHSALQALDLAGQPRFLLRFGYAPAPSGRTGRLGDRGDVA